MYTDATTYVNDTYTSSLNETPSNELGQDEFMTLLLTQLQNQDPLEPMDDTEMIAELAQFSSLEELTSLNESMDGVMGQLGVLSVNSAVDYIGKDVVAAGDGIAKTEQGTTDVTYTMPSDAETLKAHIYNEDGVIIASYDLDGTSEGTHTFSWDGLTSSGAEASNGTYSVGFEAYDANDAAIVVSPEVAGTVVGITSQNGSTVLELDDGRTVNLLYVTKVIDEDAGSAGSTDTPTDTSGDSSEDTSDTITDA